MSNTFPPTTEALSQAFGSSFEKASLTEKLFLMEAISGLMRDAHKDSENSNERLMSIAILHADKELESFNEGLRLMTILHVGIVEDCAVLAAQTRSLS